MSKQSSSQGTEQVVDQAQQAAGHVLDQTHQQAGQLVDGVKQQTTTRFEAQKDQAVTMLTTVGQALRQTGQYLREQEQAPVATYADKAATQVERVSGYMRNRDLPQLVSGAEDFARQRPAIFVGAAATLGLLAARFLKSSGSGGESTTASSTALAPTERSTTTGLTASLGMPSEPSYGRGSFTEDELGGDATLLQEAKASRRGSF